MHKKYLLLKRGDRIVATCICSDPDYWPLAISVGRKCYEKLEHSGMTFWNNLIDDDGRICGFSILLPESPIFCSSRFVTDSVNTKIDTGHLYIDLSPNDDKLEDCAQAFGAEIYLQKDDPKECVLIMQDWLQQPVAFPLDDSISVQYTCHGDK